MADRRTVLKVLAGAGGVAAGAGAAVPALGLANGPTRLPTPDTGGYTALCRLEDLAVGEPKKFLITGTEVDAWTVAPERRLGAVWLLRDGEQAVRAFSDVCPHLGCGLDFEAQKLVCPCHSSHFDLQGRCLDGPSPRGLDPIEVRVEGERVSVRYQRFELGTAERRPVG